MITLVGDGNSRKTARLKLVGSMLAQQPKFEVISCENYGNGEQFWLLQRNDKKIVCINTEGDAKANVNWNWRFMMYGVCDVYVCACNSNWFEYLRKRIDPFKIIYNTEFKGEENDNEMVKKIIDTINNSLL